MAEAIIDLADDDSRDVVINDEGKEVERPLRGKLTCAQSAFSRVTVVGLNPAVTVFELSAPSTARR